MIRISATTIALALVAVGSAHAGTVLRAGAESDSYASLSTPTRTFQVPAKQTRLRATLTGVAVVRPYSYDDNFNKVYGPDQTEPAQYTSGNVSVRCITKGQPWWRSSDASRTLKSGDTLIRLPLRNPWRCRIDGSASAYGTNSALRVDTVSMSVTLQIVTAR